MEDQGWVTAEGQKADNELQNLESTNLASHVEE